MIDKVRKILPMKLSTILSLVFLCLSASSHSQSPPPSAIRQFEVTVKSISKSQKLLEIEKPTSIDLQVGAMVLLKSGERSVVAVRVMQSKLNQPSFIAKVAKRYNLSDQIPTRESLTAYEKVFDSSPEALPSPETKRSREFEDELEIDFKDLEKKLPQEKSLTQTKNEKLETAQPEKSKLPETLDFDPELDYGSSPAKIDSDDEGVGFDEIDEIEILDRDPHWLTFELGTFANRSMDSTRINFLGAGLKYSLSTSSGFLIKKKTIQDSIGPEVGVAYYRVIGYETTNDAYNIIPLSGTIRYNLLFGETIALYVYGGIFKNIVFSSKESTVESVEQLSSILPAFGGGMFFTLGPKWKIRVNLGLDSMTAGATLRF